MNQEEKKPLTPDFSSLTASIASAALMKMGEGKREGLALARYNIDMLSLLEEKTAGNLTEEESRLLKNCLSDLRLKFVQCKNLTSENQSKEKEKAKGASKNPDSPPLPSAGGSDKKEDATAPAENPSKT